MSDLVERLRNPAWELLPSISRQLHIERALTDMSEAADEIERLRHDLANVQMRAAIDTSDQAHRRHIENDY